MMKKLLVSLGLACMTLPVESAALRQVARIGLVARTGVLRTMQSSQRVFPYILAATPQSIRSIATLSQSDKSYSKNKTQTFDFAALVPLGVAAAVVGQDMYEVRQGNFFDTMESVCDYVETLPETERAPYVKKYLERALKTGKILDILLNGPVFYLLDRKYYLYDYLTPEEQKAFSLKVLEKYVQNEKIIEVLGQVEYFTQQFSNKEKKEWMVKLIELHKASGKIVYMFDSKNFSDQSIFSKDERDRITLKVIEAHSFTRGSIMRFIEHLSRKQQMCMLEKINSPLQHFYSNQGGPLFMNFGVENIWFGPSNDRYNFQELLPLISDYVATEYAQDRIVYFHGQSSEWIPLTDMYQALKKIKTGVDFPEYFIPLRFTQVSLLTDQDTDRLINNGLMGYDATKDRSWLLFANLHLFANDEGSNTWKYVTENYDQSKVSGRLKFFEDLASLFNDQGFEQEFIAFEKDFEKIKQLYDEAIQEQGDNGRLMVISIPKKIASEISYAALPGGLINRVTINDKKTSDPVEIAENFDEISFKNEYCICLTDDMLDPQKAQIAGIKMQAFDPAIYWGTEKAQKYQAALKELMVRVKEAYEARKAQEQSKSSNGS